MYNHLCLVKKNELKNQYNPLDGMIKLFDIIESSTVCHVVR